MIARRGAVVRQTVLDAALSELAENGYAAVTIERVAARAGVNKTTVYRRWPDRENLVTDAVLERASVDFAVPDTGDIDADLHAVTDALAAWLTGPVGTPLVALLASDAARIPAVVQARHRFFAARAVVVGRRVDAAVAAGQLPAGTDPIRLLTTLVAPLYLSLLVTGQAITDADRRRAANVCLAAARAGLLA